MIKPLGAKHRCSGIVSIKHDCCQASVFCGAKASRMSCSKVDAARIEMQNSAAGGWFPGGAVLGIELDGGLDCRNSSGPPAGRSGSNLLRLYILLIFQILNDRFGIRLVAV